MFNRSIHWTVTSVFFGALLATAACKDTNGAEEEPDISSLRLTIGAANAQTVTIGSNPGCSVTGGPITIPINTTVSVTGSFLNSANSPDPVANDATVFRMSGNDGAEIAPTPTTIVWTRTGPFTGTLRGSAATTTGSMQVVAFHLEEQHEDWGECTVPITVTP